MALNLTPLVVEGQGHACLSHICLVSFPEKTSMDVVVNTE